MKRYLNYLIILLLLLFPAVSHSKTAIIGATGFTGGGTGALDAIECDDILGDNSMRAIATGDIAFVIDSNKHVGILRYNASGTDSEDSPRVVVPDDQEADCASSGQWELVTQFYIGRSTEPTNSFRDSDCTDSDQNATIRINCTDTGSGTEDCNLIIAVQKDGTLTDIVSIDADALYPLIMSAIDMNGNSISDAGNVETDGISFPGAASILSNAGDVTWTLEDNDATALAMQASGLGNMLLMNTTDNVERLSTAADFNARKIVLEEDDDLEMDGTPDGMSDDSYNGITIGGKSCGESLSQWSVVRLANSTSPWYEADANEAGEFPAHGIAISSCTPTNTVVVLVRGIIRNEGWTGLTIGSPIYLSETAGGLTQTAPSDSGDCVQLIGWALSDSEIYFDFNSVWQEVE